MDELEKLRCLVQCHAQINLHKSQYGNLLEWHDGLREIEKKMYAVALESDNRYYNGDQINEMLENGR